MAWLGSKWCWQSFAMSLSIATIQTTLSDCKDLFFLFSSAGRASCPASGEWNCCSLLTPPLFINALTETQHSPFPTPFDNSDRIFVVQRLLAAPYKRYFSGSPGEAGDLDTQVWGTWRYITFWNGCCHNWTALEHTTCLLKPTVVIQLLGISWLEQK